MKKRPHTQMSRFYWKKCCRARIFLIANSTTKMKGFSAFTLLLCMLCSFGEAFAPVLLRSINSNSKCPSEVVSAFGLTPGRNHAPSPYQRNRSSICNVQCQLFGLGAPELVVIAIAVLFVLGPEKLKDLARDAGETAKELKEVPKQFKEGLEEGEIEAKSRKAKQMESSPGEK